MSKLSSEEREALSYLGLTPRRLERAVMEGNVWPLAREYDMTAHELSWLADAWGIEGPKRKAPGGLGPRVTAPLTD